MQKLGVFTLLIFFGIGFWACSECDPTPALPRNITVSFFTKDSLKELDTTFYMIFGARTDTGLASLGGELEFLNASDSLLFSLDSANQVFLPIDFRDDTIAYIFVQKLEGDVEPLTGINFDEQPRRFDTLIFGYDTELIVLGPDCGFIEAINNLTLIKNTFDSTVIRNTELVTDSINVEIYF